MCRPITACAPSPASARSSPWCCFTKCTTSAFRPRRPVPVLRPPGAAVTTNRPARSLAAAARRSATPICVGPSPRRLCLFLRGSERARSLEAEAGEEARARQGPGHPGGRLARAVYHMLRKRRSFRRGPASGSGAPRKRHRPCSSRAHAPKPASTPLTAARWSASVRYVFLFPVAVEDKHASHRLPCRTRCCAWPRCWS